MASVHNISFTICTLIVIIVIVNNAIMVSVDSLEVSLKRSRYIKKFPEAYANFGPIVNQRSFNCKNVKKLACSKGLKKLETI